MKTSEPWTGKPRWNGRIHDVDLNKCLLPFVDGRPFLLQLENCDDFFLPVFTSPELLGVVVTKVQHKLGIVSPFTIKQVTDAEDFLDSVREGGVRVMLDPRIINDHHTKWLEVVKVGEIYKFEEKANG